MMYELQQATNAHQLRPDGTPLIASPFKPRLLRIINAIDETPDVRTLQLQPADGGPAIEWQAGQFAHWSAFGVGEAVFTLANSPTRSEFVECSYKTIGKVTNGLRRLPEGSIIGFRGPFGNRFRCEDWKGRDIVFIGGGIGTVALRAAVQYVLDNRKDYGKVTILNGARTVADLCYKQEMPAWAELPEVKVIRTVDPGGETPDWDGEVGVVPTVFERTGIQPGNCTIISCGPPIMLHYLFLSLDKLGFAPKDVVTTLENKMKCGLGLCGRCNVGHQFVCVDGPVFTREQIQGMPTDF